MKVLYFGFSWTKDQKLDSYQQSIVDTLASAGHEVHCLRGNRFLKNGSFLNTFLGDTDKIASYIKRHGIELVLCKNNSGNSKALRDKVDCPFVIWSSDEVSHLFKPNASPDDELYEFIDERCLLFVTTSECENLYKKMFPALTERIYFVPHCTNPDVYKKKLAKNEFDISFVGSSLDFSSVYRSILKYSVDCDEKNYNKLITAIATIEKNYNHDFKATIAKLDLEPMLEDLHLSADQFKMHVSNMISNNARFQALAALGEFNTAIFGNVGWVDAASFTTAILRQFKPWRKIRTFEKLCEVYQSSKVSISIPQHQVGGAIQYRVLDIMASDSLLITKRFDNSDLRRIFGDSCPVPTYSSVEELRDLCRHYLAHEEERLDLVRRCQELITEKFTFEFRLREMFKTAGLNFDQTSEKRGSVIHLKSGRFLCPFARVTSMFLYQDRSDIRKIVAMVTAISIAVGILLNLITFAVHLDIFIFMHQAGVYASFKIPILSFQIILGSLISIVDLIIVACLYGTIQTAFGGKVRAILLAGLAVWGVTRLFVILQMLSNSV